MRCYFQGIDPLGWWSWPLKICRRGQSMFWPQKCHILSFKTVVGYLCKFHIIKDERRVKMEGKTNFSKRLKQFDGLTWLTRPPYFTTDLRRCLQSNLLPGKHVGNVGKRKSRPGKWWIFVFCRFFFNCDYRHRCSMVAFGDWFFAFLLTFSFSRDSKSYFF